MSGSRTGSDAIFPHSTNAERKDCTPLVRKPKSALSRFVSGLPSLIVKTITYCLFREQELYVAQCLNVDVSSFGETREKALASLREAVELYFEDAPAEDFTLVAEAEVGQETIHA